MEMALRAQSPIFSRSRPVLVVRPANAAAAATGLAQPIIRCSRFTRSRLVRCMVASSDYPKRNPRRTSAPKRKGTGSGGYAPRPTAEYGEGDLVTSKGMFSSEATEQTSAAEESSKVDFSGNVSSSATLEGMDDADEAETEQEDEQNQSPALSSTSMEDESIDRELDEYCGKINALVGSKPEPSSLASIHGQDRSIIGVHEQDRSVVSFHEQDRSVVGVPKQSQSTAGVTAEDLMKQTTILSEQDIAEEAVEETNNKNHDGEQFALSEDDVGLGRDAEEDPLVAEDELTTTENEEQYEPDIQAPVQDDVDLQVLMGSLDELADENYSIGNMCFVFPEVVRADSFIDLYLNRSMSALAHEPDILIKGAFNGWRWNFFTEKMHKSELRGNWWCCKLYIPKQAYRLDFVFFNGDTVYENNNYNDFVLEIESDMDEHSFEDFLVEEKRWELERLAAEEAERKRQAEEERQKEEERAAMEADRAQAKAEVEMKKNKLHHMSSLASRFADNIWYIEPSTYKGGDRVKLYYNRSSRPLMPNTDIWMHGGYNIWTDGLSIAERLVKSYEKDGDWWYADVNLPERALVLDWVFADGPPGKARNYDNNGQQDFHAVVPNNISEDLFWVEEEHRIFKRLQQERKFREDVGRRKGCWLVHISCFRQEQDGPITSDDGAGFKYTEQLESSKGTEAKDEERESSRAAEEGYCKEGDWFVRVQKIKESLQEIIFKFRTERWTVPWTGETIAQVMILWIATFWFVGSWIVPFLAHAAGFSKETLTHRGQALYSLLTDITEGLAGIAILHQCLGRFRPLPSGWFEFNLKGRWHWDVALGCLLFPLVNLLSHMNINLVPMPSGPVIGVSSVEQSIVARDPVAMALYAVVVTVCAPIWEEIVFRGFLLPSLTRYMPLPWSILVSAAAFALAHFNAQRVMPLIFLGIVMGGVFARSRNLLASMVLHSLWNGFVFLDLMK